MLLILILAPTLEVETRDASAVSNLRQQRQEWQYASQLPRWATVAHGFRVPCLGMACSHRNTLRLRYQKALIPPLTSVRELLC